MAPRVKSLADDHLKSKKSVFKQRFPGFKKKATELSVLCGNSVRFICYGPDEKDLHVWPENPKAMQQIVARFNAQSHLKRKKNGCDLKPKIGESRN
ncbi:unnamed protein product [Microthlaspi erraticum]|uniref:MADS-box domain-containing protein n=1 Tax=Microthlaspi erraticum TaxID=1685480 RepID=A0A6D2HU88_9BRAS|nr:unnamed protein product [Microthlaspi erraticum]CAA7016756.1 unnamed protein product [Microthlaspi erraticum]